MCGVGEMMIGKTVASISGLFTFLTEHKANVRHALPVTDRGIAHGHAPLLGQGIGSSYCFHCERVIISKSRNGSEGPVKRSRVFGDLRSQALAFKFCARLLDNYIENYSKVSSKQSYTWQWQSTGPVTFFDSDSPFQT